MHNVCSNIYKCLLNDAVLISFQDVRQASSHLFICQNVFMDTYRKMIEGLRVVSKYFMYLLI